ncbi:FAS1-like dehydratase domain-containing protein [Actinophytocola sp.]|uniref:FAS1-like dehydratase domain-containing protein n=1 Tax=Actinophytocola sp. TaxID=1872138 RepID=UPI003D6B4007
MSWEDARRTVEALIGRQAWAPVTVAVRESDILRYAEAVGLPRPADPTVAPTLFLPPFAVGGEVGPDGRRHRPDEVVIDHPALRRRLMGGCSVDFHAPIRAGEVVEAVTTFDSVTEKQGRDGPMLLVTTATEYRTADGPRRTERWTIVHR